MIENEISTGREKESKEEWKVGKGKGARSLGAKSNVESFFFLLSTSLIFLSSRNPFLWNLLPFHVMQKEKKPLQTHVEQQCTGMLRLFD